LSAAPSQYKRATSVPLGVAERAREVARIAEALKPITNPKMASDLAVEAALAQAALIGALANVEINLKDLKDAAFVGEVRKRRRRCNASWAPVEAKNTAHPQIFPIRPSPAPKRRTRL